MEVHVEIPRLSVIIPTFQRRHLLEETLQSLVAQGFKDWECNIVDDGSTDGTREMVSILASSDPRFRWIEKPAGRPRGPSASRNIGLAGARGEFVLFFDSDDLLQPGHLEACVNLLMNSDADAVVCRIRFFPDDHPDGAAESPPLVADDFIGRAIAAEHDVFPQTVIWRRSLLMEVEPMREDITMVEDLEHAVRAFLRSKKPPILANDLRVLIRRHTASLTFDPSPTRFVQRNLHWYDAYHAMIRSLARHKYRSDRAQAFCAKRRYDLVVEVLKRGHPSFEVAKRHLHLLVWSFIERRPRPIVRLGLLGPVFWVVAILTAGRRRFGLR